MQWSLLFFLNSILLGVGLAMDAFSVSLANGLNEPQMRPRKMIGIAGTFGGFQAIMPLIGWLCVHLIAETFSAFQKAIPWIALILLLFVGDKMLIEGIRMPKDSEQSGGKLDVGTLLLQGVATSIDALSVGFTLAEYPGNMAVVSALLIASVTFAICMGGLAIGRKFGTFLAGKAQILGGVILIVIGVEIFIKGMIA